MGKSFEKMFALDDDIDAGHAKTEPAAHKIVAKKSGRRRDETSIGDIRKTYLVDEGLSKKIESISYWERTTIKATINRAMKLYIQDYERENGAVKPKPDK